MRKGVFLDKDGTLVKDVPYNINIDQIAFVPRIVDALSLLAQAGYRLLIITNQSGVGRGLFTEDQLKASLNFIVDKLAADHVEIDGYYYCPHSPYSSIDSHTIGCSCRKPQPGLIHQAVIEHAIDVHRSWIIGNSDSDVVAGKTAGSKTAYIGDPVTGRRTGADIVVETLYEAAVRISQS